MKSPEMVLVMEYKKGNKKSYYHKLDTVRLYVPRRIMEE